jgi:hypothetical protein
MCLFFALTNNEIKTSEMPQDVRVYVGKNTTRHTEDLKDLASPGVRLCPLSAFLAYTPLDCRSSIRIRAASFRVVKA